MFRNYQRKQSFVKKCYFTQTKVFHLKHLGFNEILASSRQSSKRTLPGFLQSLPGLQTLETATTSQIKTKLKRNFQSTQNPSFVPALLLSYFYCSLKMKTLYLAIAAQDSVVLFFFFFNRIECYLQGETHELFKIRRMWLKCSHCATIISKEALKWKQISLQVTF